MSLRNDLTAIADRLKEIEQILADYSAAARADQKRDRELQHGPQAVTAEITLDDRSKREAQTEANRQHRTQEGIRKAAWCAFLAATIYAGIAAIQLGEMRKAMTLDQRAWITIGLSDDKSPDWIVGKPLYIRIEVVNTGKTAAKQLTVVAMADLVRQPRDLIFLSNIPRPAPSTHFGILVPNKPQRSDIKVFEGQTAEITISDATTSEIRSGVYHIFFQGRATYLDIFGDIHWVNFCTVYPSENPPDFDTYEKCAEYNDTGDGGSLLTFPQSTK